MKKTGIKFEMPKLKRAKQKKTKVDKNEKTKKKINFGMLENSSFLSSISTKILGVFGITMFCMLVLIVFFIVKSLGYNQQYQEILENVNKINYIKTEISAQPNRMMSLCMMQKDIEESGETKVVETMLEYLDEISESIGDDAAFQGNQGMIVSTKTPLIKYQTCFNDIVSLGEDGCYPALDADITVIVQELFGLNASIANYCGSLITMEVERSKVVQQEVNQNFQRTIIVVGAVFLVLLVLSTTWCTFVVKGITRRVKNLKNEISVVAEGDLSRDDFVVHTNDEIKELAAAFNHMSDSLRNIIGKMVRVTNEMDRSTKVVSESVEINSRGSREVSESVDRMSELMERQSEMTGETLKRVLDMELVSNKISEGVKRISENADTSMEQAEKGSADIKQYTAQLSEVNQIMSQISAVASDLHTSTKEMNMIIESIANISSQTTLLSLNASIEAARAGQAGRGFAVVATEIKKLAEDTQTAANRIGSIIVKVQDNVGDMTNKMQAGLTQLDKSNELARVTQGSFSDIRQGTLVVNEDVQSIVGYMDEMSQMVEYVTKSVKDITEAIEQNASTTVEIAKTVENETDSLQEVSKSAGDLETLAQELHEAVSEFRLKSEEQES